MLLLFVACDQPRHPPYVKPELHNWPQPYTGVPKLRLHVFNTGIAEIPSRLLYRGASLLDTHVLDIVAFVIEHPRHGLLLFGTGLNHEIAAGSQAYLGTLLTVLGDLDMEEEQDLPSQLEAAQLPPAMVRYVILPDLRFDHTGELESFPEASAVVASAEYTAVADRVGVGLSLAKEYDGVQEWQFVDFGGAEPLGTFQAHTDLLRDGSVLLLDAAGVTAGGLALLVRLPTRPVLLCGNLAWTREHYFYARTPGLLFDHDAWWEKVWQLKKWMELAPELVVLPDHDWATIETVATKDMQLYIFSADAEE